MRSFRLRLAVVSALLSAAILVAFGAGSWWLIRNAKLGQLESELKNLAAREVGQLDRAEAEPARREAELAALLRMQSANDIAVLQESPAGSYQSPHWPANVLLAVKGRLGGVARSGTDGVGEAWWPGATAYAAQTGTEAQNARRGADDPRAGTWRPGAEWGRDGAPADSRPPPWGGLFPPPPPPVRDIQSGVAGGADRPNAVRTSETESRTNSAGSNPMPQDSNPAPEASSGPTDSATPVAVRPEQLPGAGAIEAIGRGADLPPRPAPVVTAFVVNADGQSWRVAIATLPQRRVVVAANLRAIDDELRGTRNVFLLVLPLALGLVGVVSWWTAGRALVPIASVTQAARRVTAQGLDKRIDATGQDREFIELIDVFNRMLARLERSFAQANRFTADAAHELKTPMAIIQGQLERSLLQAQNAPALQESISNALEELQRLASISRKLLLLAQADAGRLRVGQEPVELGRMLTELVEDARMLAPELDIQARITEDLSVNGDSTLLRQVMHNLLSNAIKYNLPGGWIRIQTARWGQRLEVSVSNASHGISQQDRARLFERFFRADPSHGRKIEGVGLGLSVSREIARAHGGDLVFKGETKNGGVEFALLIPWS